MSSTCQLEVTSNSTAQVIELDKNQLLIEAALARGHNLTWEQRHEMTKRGILGIQKMSKMLVEKAEPQIGFELERSGVDHASGAPLFDGGPALLQAIQALPHAQFGTTTFELARHQFEHNSRPYRMTGNVFSRIEQDLREYKNRVNVLAKHQGAAITAVGILPSIEPCHITSEHINDAPRYHPLIAAILEYCQRENPCFKREIQGKNGPTVIRLFTEDDTSSHIELISPHGRLLIKNTSMLLESIMTSLQVHIGVSDQKEYVGHHRVAEWISPILIALTAASPFLFMRRTGFMESRDGFVWEASMHYRRVGFLGDTWINSPLEQLSLAQKLGPLLNLQDANKIRVDNVDVDIRTALEDAKTCWPFNRTTLGFTERGIELRIENRVMSAGPTITDEVAHLAFCYGLVTGFYRELRAKGIPIDGEPEELNRYMHFKGMIDNFYLACVDALDADLMWLNGEVINARTLIRDRLLPTAKAGLLSLGVALSDCDRYLGHIQERIDFDWSQIGGTPKEWLQAGKRGCTSADLQVFLNHVLEQPGNEYLDRSYRGRALAKQLCELGLEDQQMYYQQQLGCGMTGWIKRHFGTSAN
jgi:hypothetical protein